MLDEVVKDYKCNLLIIYGRAGSKDDIIEVPLRVCIVDCMLVKIQITLPEFSEETNLDSGL